MQKSKLSQIKSDLHTSTYLHSNIYFILFKYNSSLCISTSLHIQNYLIITNTMIISIKSYSYRHIIQVLTKLFLGLNKTKLYQLLSLFFLRFPSWYESLNTKIISSRWVITNYLCYQNYRNNSFMFYLLIVRGREGGRWKHIFTISEFNKNGFD